ncbi:MAG: hypothetical protein LBP33_08350, partial [Candidatus Adiutrix sp.]|nr:hypothetical protein [Candidatus Adiutrix sp.]
MSVSCTVPEVEAVPATSSTAHELVPSASSPQVKPFLAVAALSHQAAEGLLTDFTDQSTVAPPGKGRE